MVLYLMQRFIIAPTHRTPPLTGESANVGHKNVRKRMITLFSSHDRETAILLPNLPLLESGSTY